jgi:hypothetical protein
VVFERSLAYCGARPLRHSAEVERALQRILVLDRTGIGHYELGALHVGGKVELQVLYLHAACEICFAERRGRVVLG